MLQFFREKLSKIVIWIIAGAIILFFVLSAGSYLFNTSYNNTVVKVDGDNIDLNIINQHYQRELKKNYSKFTNVYVDSKKLKQSILNDLINQVAIIKGLQRQGFLVNDEQLVGFVEKDPKFQEEGKFVKQKYINFLNTVKISDKDYQNFARQYLLLDQFRSAILFTNFITSEDLNNFIYKWLQTRDFGYLIIPRSKFTKQSVNITKAEIDNYYNTNKSTLVFPERVKISYIDVNANKLNKQIEIDRTTLYNYYKQHPEYYTLPELVNVRHILVSFDSNEDDIKSKEQADNILNKLKSGNNFQELAKKYSKDPGSAANGGDLGWLGKGEIDENFEAVAFALNKPGDLSEVFKSKFGYHIVQLIEKRSAKLSNFEEVKDKVTQHYKEEQILPKVNELHDKLLNASSSNYDLEKLSKELNLNLDTSEYFARNEIVDGLDNNQILVSAAFNQQNLNTNSEVIKLAEDHFVIFRVIDRQPAKEKTLDEAYLDIKSILENRYVTELMSKYAEDFVTKLSNYKISPSNLAKIKGLKWVNLNKVTKNSRNINSEILNFAFSFNKPNVVKVFNLTNGDCVVLQISQIQDADLNELKIKYPDFKSTMETQLLQSLSYIEQKLYEQDLYNNAKIKFIKSIDQL